MGRWSRVEALLDREVQRETKRILAKAKAAMGLSNGHANGTVTAKAKPKRRARGATPSKGRQLHGRYLGLIRGLTAAQKKQVKAIRLKDGVQAAIAMTMKLRNRATT